MRFGLWALILSVCVAACGGPFAPNAATLTPAPAPRVVTPEASGATPTPVTAITLTPSSPTPRVAVATQGVQTATPAPSAAPPCDNNLEFVGDLTVPDGAQFLAGQGLVKKWAVHNAGTCDWNNDYRLVLISGNALGPRSEVALYPAKAGTEATLEIAMVAPADPGGYVSRWQARAPDGTLFGAVVFAKIEVITLPLDTPTPTPAP
jgi:hypothetical protein